MRVAHLDRLSYFRSGQAFWQLEQISSFKLQKKNLLIWQEFAQKFPTTNDRRGRKIKHENKKFSFFLKTHSGTVCSGVCGLNQSKIPVCPMLNGGGHYTIRSPYRDLLCRSDDDVLFGPRYHCPRRKVAEFQWAFCCRILGMGKKAKNGTPSIYKFNFPRKVAAGCRADGFFLIRTWFVIFKNKLCYWFDKKLQCCFTKKMFGSYAKKCPGWK